MVQNIRIQVGVANHPGRMLLMLCPVCNNSTLYEYEKNYKIMRSPGSVS